MKKVILLLIGLTLLCLTFEAKATIHSVTVQDFSFTPASMTVNVGDTIQWTWLSGSHTTTSNTIPDGAASWDQPMNSASVAFTYVVMLPGTYNYNCTIHPTVMIASFTAVSSTGISPVGSAPNFEVGNTLLSDELWVNYQLGVPATVTISLYSLTGVRVKNFTSAFHYPGEYSETYVTGKLESGMYFLSLQTSDAIVTRKVVVE